jgi:hypothetical protein
MNILFPSGLLVGFALLGLASSQPGAQLGQLAYVKGDVAVVETLSSGKTVTLPNSRGAQLVALSPRDGTAVYFVKIGAGGGLFADDEARLNGLISIPPYRTAEALPAGFRNVTVNPFTFEWTRDGSYVQAGEYRFDPRLNKAWKTTELNARAASSDGKVTAWLRDDRNFATALEVAGGKTSKSRTIFSGANTTGWLEYFKGALEVDVEMAKRTTNWWIGDPAVSPDGEAVYFALNGGQSGGAAGNTEALLFKFESKTDRVVALRKLGKFEGRLPSFQVSPDGKKLLARGSFHVSAAENPAFLEIVNLETSQRVGVDWEKFAPRNNFKQATNLIQGQCWLRDSRTVAVAASEFDIGDFYGSSNVGEIKAPRHPQDFSVYLMDSVSGKSVKRIAGASSPSCR